MKTLTKNQYIEQLNHERDMMDYALSQAFSEILDKPTIERLCKRIIEIYDSNDPRKGALENGYRSCIGKMVEKKI